MNTAVLAPFPVSIEFRLPRVDFRRDRGLRLAVAVSLAVHAFWLGWIPGVNQVEPEPMAPLSIRLAAPAAPATPAAVSPAPTFRPSLAEPRPAERPRAEIPTPVLSAAANISAAPSFSVPATEAAPLSAEPPHPTAPVQRTVPTTDPLSLAGYGRDVASAVARYQRYPRLAQMRQWQGTALLQLQISADGRLADARVLSSSGHEILDRQALDMVREAVPLPPLPAALVGRALTVDVPVTFRLAG